MPFFQDFSKIRLLILLTTFLFISGCGFQLKGSGELSKMGFQSIKILESEGVREDFLQAFIQSLKSYGIEVVDSLEQADIVLHFQPTNYQTSHTGLSRQGDATTELIKISQSFLAKEASSEKIIVETTTKTLRNRQVDSTAVLASDRELLTIQNQMAKELALKVIDRINRAILKKQSISP